HLRVASALGATLGQGWHFGRPAAGPASGHPTGSLDLTVVRRGTATDGSPFAALPPGVTRRRAPKALLVELSKHLEREAMRVGETCVVAATFQEAVNFTAATAQRYRDLVERTGFVCALGEGLRVEPLPGLRGAALDADDPVRGEWDLVVVSPHFCAALLATDLGSTGPDLQREFEYALTYDRATVVEAAQRLLSRVAPEVTPPRVHGPQQQPADDHADAAALATLVGAPASTAVDGEAVLHRALGATNSGITIVDVRRPDQPLVYANTAFAELAGLPLERLLGRNCRFLQGPDTDRDAVARVRAAVARGEECRETLLNYRGEQRIPWWNEIYLAPVVDAEGRVVQYIGVQNDVTARVEAQRALVHERDRAQSYLTRIEQLAYTDPLTGLMNRRRLESEVEAALLDAQLAERGLALLFLDLDGFKPVNDELGHAAGDELLVRVADRLRATLRRSDLLARLGGDEFLVALPGLDPTDAAAQAEHVAEALRRAVAQPIELAGRTVSVSVSVGWSAYPADADAFGPLMHLADERMYGQKAARLRV
ncbi:MAG TPA: diguanylate cyclase, partial [Angustibacter sp.]|nr:diguanylate cyclase [Angustibacter sp.]